MNPELPEDARPNLLPLVDASGGDFYTQGDGYATPVGVNAQEDQGFVFAGAEDVGVMDPRALRFHDLQQETPNGAADRRLAPQIVTDYSAPYEDVKDGQAPYGQPEYITAANRSTREADTTGRVAVTTSHRIVVDSEDERYALALTMREVPLAPAGVEHEVPPPKDSGAGGGLPPGVTIIQPGAPKGVDGASGSVITAQGGVSINGVFFSGGAAAQAAKEAAAAGGTAADCAAWARAATFGGSRPPIAGGNKTKSEPPPAKPEPDRNAAGSITPENHPAGYVWDRGQSRIGLLGTLVDPGSAGGSYFPGKDGTPIGPLPLRHDAQVTMGPELVGRVLFVSEDAANVQRGDGTAFKGEMWFDSQRANIDTELGLETGQWRPVIHVSADIPASKDPPPFWSPENEPEEPEEEEENNPEKKPGAGKRPKPGRGKGDSGGKKKPTPPEDEGEPRKPGDGFKEPGGYAEPIAPEGQSRDYTGRGIPCPNSVAGVPTRKGAATLSGVKRIKAGLRDFHGHPAITMTPTGDMVLGGFAGGAPPRGVRVTGPDDRPGRLTVGLGGGSGQRVGGFDVESGPSEGVKGGSIERENRARKRRARERAKKREQDRIDRLKQKEQAANAAGKKVKAKRLKKARKRAEDRQRERRERSDRLKKWRDSQKERAQERVRRAKEAKERKRRKREKLRERERKRRGDRSSEDERREKDRKRVGLPEGGYIIGGGRVLTGDGGNFTAEEIAEAERKAAEERRKKYGDPRLGFPLSFGEANVLTNPMPYLGQPGGPRLLEDHAHLMTATVRAVQDVVVGAFGGPSFLAANIGVVHQNRPQNPPAGSRIGAHWTCYDGQLDIGAGQDCVELISTLEASAGDTVTASSGGVVRVIREHVGGGSIRDDRPLVLLENDRAINQGRVKADMISDLDRRFYVSHGQELTAAKVRAYRTPGETGRLFEVGTIHKKSRAVSDAFVYVDSADGILASRKGFAAREGAGLDLYDEEENTQIQLQNAGEGLVQLIDPTSVTTPTLYVQNLSCSKLTCVDLDPENVTMDPVASRPTPLAASKRGTWWDSGTNSLVVWDGTTDRTIPGRCARVYHPNANVPGPSALSGQVWSWGGLGVMRYTQTTITPDGAMAVASGEGSELTITDVGSDGSLACSWSGHLPSNFKGWNTNGIRLRHKLFAITTGSAQITLTITAPAPTFTVSTTTRSSLSSADGSYQWITAAGSGLSALTAGDFFTIGLTVTFSGGTDSATLLLGRIEIDHD